MECQGAQDELENRKKVERRASTKAQLERILSRPNLLQERRSGLRVPLKETRIGSSGAGGGGASVPRDSVDSPTGSINLISFEEEATPVPTIPVSPLTNFQRPLPMDTSNLSGVPAPNLPDGDKLRKTMSELRQIFSRHPPQMAMDCCTSRPHRGSSNNRNETHSHRKTIHNLRRQESREEPTTTTLCGVETPVEEFPTITPGIVAMTARRTISAEDSNTSQTSGGSMEGRLSHIADTALLNPPLSVAGASSSSFLPNLSIESQNRVKSPELSNEALRVSEKVVWITGRNQEEIGTVEWKGNIGGIPTAGVHFEHAVGNTDGIYKGTRYFTCPQKHGGFVPVQALIKYDDYFCANSPIRFSRMAADNSKTQTNVYLDTAFSFTDGDTPEHKMWTMSDEEDNVIICAICQDPLISSAINTPDVQRTPINDDGMVSTFCGHLFHAYCLNKWFHMKAAQPVQECPYCKKMMNTNSTIRIFPVLGKP